MKTCPDCRAPNPARLARCYACGVRLDSRPKSEPLPGEGTYPCLGCAGPVPQHLADCPHCGRLGLAPKAPTRSLRRIEPPGWSRTSLPDGTLLLSRRTWGRLSRDFSAWLGGAGIATYVLGFGLASFALRLHAPGVMFVALMPFVALFALWILWTIWGKEEIRLGPNFLEKRVGLWRWQSRKRVTDAALVIRSVPDTRSDLETFALIATGHGGSLRLETGAVPYLRSWLGNTDSSRTLPPELIFLADLVGETTGWSVTPSV
jgi:hypothetical protein